MSVPTPRSFAVSPASVIPAESLPDGLAREISSAEVADDEAT
jgi:hypothetical protein